jgi:hypothetical protein
VDPTGKFAYVANLFSNNVSGYTINATTGALTAISGSPFAAGVFPDSVAVDPTGKFAYVGNAVSNNVSGYTINATTGALTAISGSPFAGGMGVVAVDPTGKFAYVTNQASNNVSGYTINATTGALTAISGSPFAAGLRPSFVTVSTGCTAPVISGTSATPDVLWPPNHKFVDVTIDYTETSPCAATCSLSVTSNEPPVDDKTPEFIVVDAHHVQLRAERLGTGDGRIYTITITCTNAAGTTTKSVTVTVPHNQ